MLLKLIGYAVSVLLLVATPAWADDAESRVRDERSYFPTTAGTEWTYKASGGEIVVRVVGPEKVAGEDCVKVETLKKGKVVGSEHVAVKSDGLYRCAISGKPISPPILFLKLPFKEGEPYPNKDWKIGDVSIAGTFRSGSEAKITVLKGEKNEKTYDTITSEAKLTISGNEMTVIYYFAKGVGMVKQEVIAKETKGVIELKKMGP